ncbi:nuclear transport factor 2 family protein [Pedobacter lithocola]|uniref:Nuclear transport factor 2 family protein n=1 Tax=Pedobacter lithocola TaxID=1908239 RepID=A0ABV8PBU9_9SPHI
MKVFKNQHSFDKYAVIALAVISLITTYSCKSEITETDRNKKLILNQFKKWQLGTGSVFDLLDDQAIWTVSGSGPGVISGTYVSKKQLMDKVVYPISAKLSRRLSPKLVSILAEGNLVVAQWEGNSIALDGKPYKNSYVWYMTLKNDRIIRVTAYLDTYILNDLMERVKISQPNKHLNYE